MEHYDVIIIGAGIAGCGLAYNLHRFCPEKKVLVIDGSKLNENTQHHYKILFKENKEEYNLPFIKRLKGIKNGSGNNIVATFEDDSLYIVDYKDICKSLLKRSKADVVDEQAIDVNYTTLTTNQNKYTFKYLVDCSGNSFFIRKKFHLPLPFRYYIGKTKVFKGKNELNKNYYYNFFTGNNFFEEIFSVNDQFVYSEWCYSKQPNPNLIITPPNTYYQSKINKNNLQLIQKGFASIPVGPVLPIVYKNFAFLGDSFGNAAPIGGFGTLSSLRASKLLAKAIMEDDLKLYSDVWKKKYLDFHLKQLASKMDRLNNTKIMERIKNYPTTDKVIKLFSKDPKNFIQLLKNDPAWTLPENVRNAYPKRQIIFLLCNYGYLKIKYNLLSLFRGF